MKKRPQFFYGWVIVGIAFVCQFLIYGVRNCFAVLYVAILNDFGWSRADTVLIFSINVIVYGLTAPLAGSLVERFGPRKIMPIGVALLAIGAYACSQANEIWHLYIFFGVVMAVGMSLTGFVSNMAILANWFVRKRGAAFGIFISGWGLSFLLTTVCQHLISIYSWQTSFLILGTLVLVVLMPIILIFHRRHPSDMGLLPDGASELTNTDTNITVASQPTSLVIDKQWADTEWSIARVLRTPRFWAIFFSSFLVWGVMENVLVAHQVAFIMDSGVSATMVGTIIGFQGIMFTVGNLTGGFLSDRWGRELVFSIGSIIAILSIIILLLFQGSPPNWMLFLYGLTLGIGLGINGPTASAALADMFQGKNLGVINGLTIMGFGLAGSISPWLVGLIFDLIGSYKPSFLMLIPVSLLSILCMWLACPRKIRRVSGKVLR